MPILKFQIFIFIFILFSLVEHPWEVQQTVYATLLKLLQNVVEKPTEPKFRSINPNNAVLKAKVFDVNGGRALLEAGGFKQASADAPLTCTRDDDLILREAFGCLKNHVTKQSEKQQRTWKS